MERTKIHLCDYCKNIEFGCDYIDNKKTDGNVVTCDVFSMNEDSRAKAKLFDEILSKILDENDWRVSI